MARRRVDSPNEGVLEQDVLKALGSLDTLNRRSGTIRRVPKEEPPVEPVTDTKAVMAPVWEKEPDTLRFVGQNEAGSGSEVVRASSERRAARRVALEVAVTIMVEGEEVTGTSEDISLTGMFVKTARLLHSGKEVPLRFDLPHGVVEVIGVVVRFRTPAKALSGGVGLCFKALSEAQADCIEAYCESTDSIR